MARFSVCRGDDGEGPSNRRSRKRQRLPSIDEDEEDAENADVRSSGEEDAESSDARSSGEEDEETQNPGMESDPEDTSGDSDREIVIEERRVKKSTFRLDSSSSKNSPLPVTLSDSDVLDCPICCEPLKIPIFQCDNGHLACSLCCTKVRNRCPSCTLPIGYIRNRAMENVIEACRVLCQNAKYGCKENTSYGNRSTHEKLCVFNPCTCPIPNCNYTSNHKDLNNHVRNNHKDGVLSFCWNIGFLEYLGFRDETKIYQEEDGHVMVVQSFKTRHAAVVSVSCIASVALEVRNISCSIEVIDGSLKQSFMVKNIPKVWDKPPENGFMLIPSYMFSSGGCRKFSICISRGRYVPISKLVINSFRCI